MALSFYQSIDINLLTPHLLIPIFFLNSVKMWQFVSDLFKNKIMATESFLLKWNSQMWQYYFSVVSIIYENQMKVDINLHNTETNWSWDP